MTSSPCRRARCKAQGIFELCVWVWGMGGGGGMGGGEGRGEMAGRGSRASAGTLQMQIFVATISIFFLHQPFFSFLFWRRCVCVCGGGGGGGGTN